MTQIKSSFLYVIIILLLIIIFFHLNLYACQKRFPQSSLEHFKCSSSDPSLDYACAPLNSEPACLRHIKDWKCTWNAGATTNKPHMIHGVGTPTGLPQEEHHGSHPPGSHPPGSHPPGSLTPGTHPPVNCSELYSKKYKGSFMTVSEEGGERPNNTIPLEGNAWGPNYKCHPGNCYSPQAETPEGKKAAYCLHGPPKIIGGHHGSHPPHGGSHPPHGGSHPPHGPGLPPHSGSHPPKMIGGHHGSHPPRMIGGHHGSHPPSA